MMHDQLEDEWACIGCGHRDYGEGFTPLDKADEGQRHREPSHGRLRL